MTAPTGILFDDPRAKPLSTTGQFQAGCYWCFFSTGTTTLVNVFADGALTTPLSQPAPGSVNPSAGTVSASDGRFVPIYLNPGVIYRVQLYSAAGVKLSDTDPYVVPGGTIGQTAAEAAAGITPTNFSYPPGAFRRYGADPLGVSGSSTAIGYAIAANAEAFDDYPGGGTYLIDSEILFTRFPVYIHGQVKSIPNASGGTRFVLATGAGSGAAMLRTSAASTGIEIKRIAFAWQTYNSGQIAIRFGADTRSFKVEDNSFTGTGSSGTNVTAVQLDGTGTYSGDGNIVGNFFNGVLIGVDLQNVCTSIRIAFNEFYGNISGATANYGVKVGAACSETTILANFFSAHNRSILGVAGSAYIKQIANNYENAGVSNFEWQQSGSSYVGNISVGETFASNPSPNPYYVVPFNNTAGCIIIAQPGLIQIDKTIVKSYQGFNEANRATNLGQLTTPTFSAGNFTASGSQTWTVSSGNTTTYQWDVVGGNMKLKFWIDSSSIGGTPSTELRIAIPGGYSATGRVRVPISVRNNGTLAFGVAEVQNADTFLRLYCDVTAATNWTASSSNAGVFGEIDFPIA